MHTSENKDRIGGSLLPALTLSKITLTEDGNS